MQVINTIQHLKMFDVVMSHAYRMQEQAEKFNMPEPDYEKYKNAQTYALYLNRLGLLPYMYKRIMEGAV